jgi:hypothetical protein
VSDAHDLRTDVLIIGGGLGGVAAAIAACRAGAGVVLVEECRWLGGQLTSQGVPADEHPWIETHGSTRGYRALRDLIRSSMRSAYPLTDAARADRALNPGSAWVSPLSVEPRIAALAIEILLQPWTAVGRLRVLRQARVTAVHVDGDVIESVSVALADGATLTVVPEYVLDASETGELLDVAGVEHRVGAESNRETGEPSAPGEADPGAVQAVTHCFALEHADGDHTIDRPAGYDHWRAVAPPGWAGPLLSWTYPNPRTGAPTTARFDPRASGGPLDMEAALQSVELWSYRRVLDPSLLKGTPGAGITIVNWPQNDYLEGPVWGPDEARHRVRAKELSAALLYWMQTEAPRPDGGTGWPGLRLRPDVLGTPDGFAQTAYIREARRIRALTTPVEQDLSLAVRGEADAVVYQDAVGVGAYRIDLHPTLAGDGYLDIASLPFTIPLGALIPVRMRNLIAAGKTIGTTHITNGCYRVHPVEWTVGEIAGALAAECLASGVPPVAIHGDAARFADFRAVLHRAGVDAAWERGERLP